MTENPRIVEHVSAIGEHPGRLGGTISDVTLRDLFAGLAMQALVASPEVWGDETPLEVSAYKMADAMLKARAESGGQGRG